MEYPKICTFLGTWNIPLCQVFGFLLNKDSHLLLWNL